MLRGFFKAALLGVILLAMNSGVALSQTDPRLVSFLKQFDVIAQNGKPVYKWVGSDSPWAPYLKKQSSEGLVGREITLYMAAEKDGNCFALRFFERIGYLQLYPFLKPAFSREDVKEVFEKRILSIQSAGSRRCLAYRNLKKYRKKLDAQKLKIKPFDFTLEYRDRKLARGHTLLQNQNERSRNWALEGLAKIGFCLSYKPALADILKYIKKPQLLALTPEEKVYLFAKAKVLNIEYHGDTSWIYAQVTSDKRAQLERSALSVSLKPLIKVLPYFHKVCGSFPWTHDWQDWPG